MLKAKNLWKQSASPCLSIPFSVDILHWSLSIRRKRKLRSRVNHTLWKYHLELLEGKKSHTKRFIIENAFWKTPSGWRVTAALWSTSIEEEANNSSRRGLVCYQGGPGSASIWLHIGFVGPKVVQGGSRKDRWWAAPYQFVENKQALLDFETWFGFVESDWNRI